VGKGEISRKHAIRLVTSLHGALYPRREEASPHVILAYLDGSCIKLERFVRVESLPPDVQMMVNRAIDNLDDVDECMLHEDTVEEIKMGKVELNEKN